LSGLVYVEARLNLIRHFYLLWNPHILTQRLFHAAWKSGLWMLIHYSWL